MNNFLLNSNVGILFVEKVKPRHHQIVLVLSLYGILEYVEKLSNNDYICIKL